MKTISRRLLSLFLVFTLLQGLMPSVYAAADDSTTATTESIDAEPTVPLESTPEETIPAETQETVSTQPSIDTTIAPSENPGTEETVFPEETQSAAADESPANSPSMMTTSDDIMLTASTQNNIMLFDFANNGNYTTVLNTQLSVPYKPNGSGTTRTAYIKNLGWHFARYGNIPYPDDPLYCIEPWRNYGASTSGNSVDRDVTLNGSSSTSGGNIWYSMPTARRRAIGLILLYSNEMWDHSISVTTTKKDSNPNVPLRIATQFLIYLE